MKKTGFTLAEVLVTLGIIGVVAALSLPSLMNLKQEAGMGPLLAKTQATVEEAVGRVMLEYPDMTLKKLDSDGYFTSELNKHILWTSEDGGYRLKDGVVIAFEDDTEGEIPAAGGKPFKKLKIDLNGESGKPNTAGVDKFEFLLSSKGLVIPQGCAAMLASNNWKVGKDYKSSECGKFELGGVIGACESTSDCGACEECSNGKCVSKCSAEQECVDGACKTKCGKCQERDADGNCQKTGGEKPGTGYTYDDGSCGWTCAKTDESCGEGKMVNDQCECVDNPDYCDKDTVSQECASQNREFNEANCSCGDCLDDMININGGCEPLADCDPVTQYITESNECANKKKCWDNTYVRPEENCPACEKSDADCDIGYLVNSETCECEWVGCHLEVGMVEVTLEDGTKDCVQDLCYTGCPDCAIGCDPLTGCKYAGGLGPSDCNQNNGYYWSNDTCKCEYLPCCQEVYCPNNTACQPCRPCDLDQEVIMACEGLTAQAKVKCVCESRGGTYGEGGCTYPSGGGGVVVDPESDSGPKINNEEYVNGGSGEETDDQENAYD